VRVRLLTVVLLVQVAIGIGLVAVVLSGDVPLVDELGIGGPEGSSAPVETAVARAPVDRFDEARAFGWVRRQVAIGPRPAGSPESRRLARLLRARLPGGRFQAVPGRLRNVIGLVPGRDPARTVVVGAHYDTKDEPDFVGNRNLSISREANSDPALWYRLRQAAGRVGAGRAFPRRVDSPVSDDHIPFIRAGVPSIDLIDSGFLRGRCWHQLCDDLPGISARSLDLSGETVFELLRTL
jgi:hypothetical protein